MSSLGQPQTNTMDLPGLLGLWIFGKKAHGRCARCEGNEVFGSVKKVTIGDKSVDGVGDSGLMSGCQISANPTIQSSVT